MAISKTFISFFFLEESEQNEELFQTKINLLGHFLKSKKERVAFLRELFHGLIKHLNLENMMKENKFYSEKHTEGDDLIYCYLYLMDHGKDISVFLSDTDTGSILDSFALIYIYNRYHSS